MGGIRAFLTEKERGKRFAERLLSTKLLTIVTMWITSCYFLETKKISDNVWSGITLGAMGFIVAASYVDKNAKNGNGNVENKV